MMNNGRLLYQEVREKSVHKGILKRHWAITGRAAAEDYIHYWLKNEFHQKCKSSRYLLIPLPMQLSEVCSSELFKSFTALHRSFN